METIYVCRKGSFIGLGVGAALLLLFLVALFLAPLLKTPFSNGVIFAGLVTLLVAASGYLFKTLFGVRLTPRPILRLGPDGITINALRFGVIPWRAICRIQIVETPAHIASSTLTVKPRLIEIWTDDDDHYRRQMPPIQRLYKRTDQKLGAPLFRVYPDSLTMSANDMIAIFRKRAPHADFEGLGLVERDS